MNAMLASPVETLAQGLELDGWGLAIGHRILLDGVSLSLRGPGLALLGGGPRSGKSAMVQTLAGLHGNNPLFRTWGRASLQGRPIAPDWRPVLVRAQMAVLRRSLREALLFPSQARGLPEPDPVASLIRHGLSEWVEALDRPVSDLCLLDRRTLNILSEALAEPPLLLIDAPGHGLDEGDAARLAAWLAGLARHQRLLVACDHPGFIPPACDTRLRIEGARVVCEAEPPFEPAPAQRAASPERPALASIAPAMPEVRAPHPPHSVRTRATEDAAMVGLAMLRDSRAPEHFHWIVPGQLATCVTPGSRSTPREDTLDRLARIGVLLLIGIDADEFDPDAAASLALETIHQPVSRTRQPSSAQLRMLAAKLEGLLDKGWSLVLHGDDAGEWRALILAAWMVLEGGQSAATALERLGLVDPSLNCPPELAQALADLSSAA